MRSKNSVKWESLLVYFDTGGNDGDNGKHDHDSQECDD